jgi:hypothetical protein
MNSVARVAGGIAAAALVQAGAAAMPSAAQAAPVITVPCSTPALIAAVTMANTVGSGLLKLASSCDYVLTSATGSGRGPDGLPVIHGNIVLDGGRNTRISRASTAPRFRIIEVAAGAVLGIRHVAISGGVADGTVPGTDTGGAILNSRGSVALLHSRITDSTADSGAGVSNDSGRVLVSDSIIAGNTTRMGGGGGGFYNDGSLLVARSRITGNHANTNGGGVYNGQGGRTELLRSVLEDNTAGVGGGGVYNAFDGRLVAINSLIRSNTATSGGGIKNAGIPDRVRLIATLVIGNMPDNCDPLNTIAGCVN